MRGYFIVFCWLQIVTVVVSTTTEGELTTEASSSSSTETTTTSVRRRTTTRVNKSRRIRGSGNIEQEQHDRSLFIKQVEDWDVEEVVSERKDPPTINKDQFKLANDLTWRERMFPDTEPPTIAPTTSRAPSSTPSASPTKEEDNPGYFQQLDRPLRIACAGDSLTRGRDYVNSEDDTYPSQLGQMLGESVYNFGHNSATAMLWGW